MADLLPPDEEETGTRRMDEEVKAISAILRLLADLEEPAKERIIAYVSDRFAKSS